MKIVRVMFELLKVRLRPKHIKPIGWADVCPAPFGTGFVEHVWLVGVLFPANGSFTRV